MDLKNLNKKDKLTIAFSISLIMIFCYLGGISTVLFLTIFLTLELLLFYIIIKSFKKIYNRKLKIFNLNNFKEYAKDFIHGTTKFLLILSFILGGIGYYYNYISPAKMPTFTISNGEKNVVFQGMSHIGNKTFYEKVKDKIKNYKTNGYVMYYEGVGGGSKKNMQKFNEALGIKMNKDLYKNVGKLYGLENQKHKDFLNLINNKDVNVDLNINEIIKIYEKMHPGKAETNNSIDANAMILDKLTNLNERQLDILRFVNKGMMNAIMKNYSIQEYIIRNIGNGSFFDVVLGKRNENLAKTIAKSNDKEIFVLYGVLHFRGTLELLQSYDSNWKIIKTDYLYPITDINK